MIEELTVVIVNYNGFQDTIGCLKSIKASRGILPYIIIVDNASSEETDFNLLQQIYPKLTLIKNEENLGFGRANNIGIKWAQNNLNFDYLLLLNNDTIIEPDSFFHLKEAFKLNSKIGITTSKTMYEKNRSIVWYGGGEINYKRGWPKIEDYNQKSTKAGANKARFVSFVSGCVMMFSKKSIEDIKGFDEELFMYCEDLELSIRAAKMGYKFYYEPKSVIYHKVQGSSNANEVKGMNAKNPNLDFLFFNMKSNQWIVMRKSLKGKEFLNFSIYYWLEFLYSNLKFSLQLRPDILKTSNRILKRILNFK